MMQQRAGLSPRTILVGLGALAFVLYVLLSSSAPAVPPAHHPHGPVGPPPPSSGLESQQNGQPTSKKQDYLNQELLKRLSDVVQRVSALEEQYQQKMMNSQSTDDNDNSDKKAGEKSEATPAQLQRELEELRKVVAQLAKETKVWASAEEAKRNETNRLKLELAELREAVARKAEERAGDKAVPPSPTAQADAKAGAEPTGEAPAKQEEPAPAATGEAKKGLPTVSPAGKPSGRQQQQQAPAQAKKEEKVEKVAAIVDDEVDEVDEDAMDDGEGPKIPPECVDLWMAEGDKAAFVRALAGQKAKNYLEWSDGSSTLCAARLAANVTAIVYSQDCKGLRERLNASRVTNVNLICPPVADSDRQTAEQEGGYAQFRDYVDVVDKVGVPHYDAVFIDGRARVACAKKTLNYTSGNSLVMLYDWQPLRTEVKRWYEDVPAYRLDLLGVLRRKKDV